jgi:hypothetical protein
MRKVPVNPECDPRITCQLSIQSKRCLAEDNKMKDITNAWDPKQVCSGVSGRINHILPDSISFAPLKTLISNRGTEKSEATR